MSTFTPPSEEDCLRAIGLIETDRKTAASNEPSYQLKYKEVYYGRTSVTPQLAQAFAPDPTMFAKIPVPGSNDWLACHFEEGQTFQQFNFKPHNVPDSQRNTIHLLPLTFFEEQVSPDVMADLAEYATYFFGMPVQILQPKPFSSRVPNRINQYTHNRQVHAGKILDEMCRLLPKNSFCVGGITMCDMYPRDEWNFVFGLASSQKRVGVYSLARYQPGFYGDAQEKQLSERQQKAALLKRACLLMCHEISHMFGLKHCIYYHCLMNGSNHLVEFDAKPLYLCPVCLRKLHLSCQFDILTRYQHMHRFCADRGMEAEAAWFGKRAPAHS